ncbi:MAG: hypothetical protein NTV51_27800 [Verrucomicrobia bacterium]|nr:hypothetical protein [Verrucomicrobiota bacterium]
MGKKEMAVRYSYLALEEDHRLVAEWFSALPEEVTVSDGPDRVLFYFHAMATKPLPTDGTIDQQTTPLVFVEKPRKKRGTLWTDAEVYFTPSPLKRQFPTLGKISQSFEKWLRGFDLVFAQKNAAQSKWTYYLEAGIQNYCEEVYALPEAMAALRSGQYFVHHRASAGALDTLARSLRLRGYHAEPA